MFVYAVRGGAYAKIGVSDDIKKRLASFNGGMLPFEVNVICLGETSTPEALAIEADILGMMPGRLRGEWIDGSVSDAEIVAAFSLGLWTSPLLVKPTEEQLAEANRNARLQRTLEASRAVVEIIEARTPAGVDWHKIATELTERGDIKALRKVRNTFKAKRLASQNRVAKRRLG